MEGIQLKNLPINTTISEQFAPESEFQTPQQRHENPSKFRSIQHVSRVFWTGQRESPTAENTGNTVF